MDEIVVAVHPVYGIQRTLLRQTWVMVLPLLCLSTKLISEWCAFALSVTEKT